MSQCSQMSPEGHSIIPGGTYSSVGTISLSIRYLTLLTLRRIMLVRKSSCICFVPSMKGSYEPLPGIPA